MRCRTCDYELWNLAPGPCPECGTRWEFENYRFRHRAAQFLCPHCEHSYGGNDSAGLPTPREFTCASCNNAISLGRMRALPAPGTNRDQAMEDQHPWMERARIGRWRAFRQTTRLSIVAPTALGSALPENLTLTAGLLYSIICTSLAIGGCAALPVLGVFFMEILSTNQTVFGGWTVLWPVPLGALVFAVGFQLLILAWGGCAHLLLTISGTTEHPWRHTMAAIHFCSAPMIACAIPCCGVYVAMISVPCMICSAIFALVGAQRVSAGRAALAVLVPSLGLLALIGGLLVWAVMMISSLARGLPAPVATPQSAPSSVAGDGDETPDSPMESDAQLLPAP